MTFTAGNYRVIAYRDSERATVERLHPNGSGVVIERLDIHGKGDLMDLRYVLDRLARERGC